MIATSLFDEARIARATARILIETRSVNFRADEPYTFTSGIKSPVYIDCRRLISFPRARAALMDFLVAKLVHGAGFEQFDAVAGGETAGIPFAAWIAERFALPMLYVRKKPKGFGRDAQIEGHLETGGRVLLVEDLATNGGSKVNFAGALRAAGFTVDHGCVVFYYDIFKDTLDQLASQGLRLHYLATWWDVLALCREQGHFDAATLATVEGFLNSPLEWSAAHGGIATQG